VLETSVDLIQVFDPKEPASPGAGVPRLNTYESARVARLASGISDNTGRPANYEVLHDTHPAKAILRYCDELGAGLIAMATHGERGVTRLLKGSVTADVIRQSHVPVLAVCPSSLW